MCIRDSYKRFLDFQNDVAVSDVEIALREGYRSIEHVKRYTTLGMATDQGKTSNLNGLQLVSEIENKVVPAVGHTTFRPPYTPISIGAIVGREVGKHSKPTRKSPMHYWHEKNMLFSLMQVFGCVQDIIDEEMKIYLKLQKEKLKM